MDGVRILGKPAMPAFHSHLLNGDHLLPTLNTVRPPRQCYVASLSINKPLQQQFVDISQSNVKPLQKGNRTEDYLKNQDSETLLENQNNQRFFTSTTKLSTLLNQDQIADGKETKNEILTPIENEIQPRNKVQSSRSKTKRRKSGKRKTKSATKRKTKSSSKKKATDEKARGELVLPIRKNLSSCFPLYSTQKSNSLEKSNTLVVVKSNFFKPASPIGVKTTTKRFLSLPPAPIKLPNTKLSRHASLTETRSWPDSVTLPKGQQRSDSITFPPTPLKLFNESIIAPKTSLIAAPYPKDLIRRNIDIEKKRQGSLGERLNLIHHYGNDYHRVAQKREEERRKENYARQLRSKEAEKVLLREQKCQQRKKIYALNCLMTALELEKFNNFFSNEATLE